VRFFHRRPEWSEDADLYDLLEGVDLEGVDESGTAGQPSRVVQYGPPTEVAEESAAQARRAPAAHGSPRPPFDVRGPGSDDVDGDALDATSDEQFGNAESKDDRPTTRMWPKVAVVVAVLVALAISNVFLSRNRRSASVLAPGPSVAAGATTARTTEPAASVLSPITASAVRATLPATTATTTRAPNGTSVRSSSPNAAATSTAVGADAPTSVSANHAEVTTLQVVPAIRNVIVVVNSTSYATNADGTITLAAADRHGTAQVVGLNATPALEQVSFTGWGDGDSAPARSLDSVDGPVALLGFDVRDHVQANAGAIAAGEATINFASAAGPIVLTVGVPQWVLKVHAVATPTGLSAQPVVYTATSLTRGATTVALSRATFTPAPEAIWVVVA
jgi:hypothetical protein